MPDRTPNLDRANRANRCSVERCPITPGQRQRGVGLIDALIAFLVLSLGMIGVARVQVYLRLNADIARERSEAVRLAEEDLETLRGFTALDAGLPASGSASYDAIASASRSANSRTGHTTSTDYFIERRIVSNAEPRSKSVSVAVSWTDRGGSAQQISVASILAGVDPALSGALGLAPDARPVHGWLGRSIHIPLTASDLGNGSSAFKPVSSGTLALVFDNLSGRVTAQCSGVEPGTSSTALRLADLRDCSAAAGHLISGSVRFSTTSPPNAAHAQETPLPVALRIVSAGGTPDTAPWCAVEAMKTVSYVAGSSQHLETVPVAATPASLGLGGWTDRADRFVAYYCVAHPTGAARWSGRTVLVPSGWRIGTDPGERRVCRFTSDLDSSGTIDANAEHPATYKDVDSALARQNFLVINGDEDCPDGARTPLTDTRSEVFVDLSTAPHQP